MNNRGILLGCVILPMATAVFYAADVKLPPPFASPSVNNGPHVIPQPAGAQLHVPDGFSVDVYADGFERPRYIILGPGGELLLSDAADGPAGTVYVMPLSKADGYKSHDS